MKRIANVGFTSVAEFSSGALNSSYYNDDDVIITVAIYCHFRFWGNFLVRLQCNLYKSERSIQFPLEIIMIEQSCHEVRVDFISAWQQSTLNAPHNYSNSAFCISLQHEQFHLTAFHGYHVVKNFCFYLLLSKTSLQQQRKVMDHYFPRGTHKGNWKHQIIFRKPRNRSLGGRFLN